MAIDGFTINGSKFIAGQPNSGDLRLLDNILNLQAMAASNHTNMIFGYGENLTLTNNHFTTTGFNPSNSAVVQMAGTYDGSAESSNTVTVTGNTFTGIADFTHSNPTNGQSTLQLNFSGVHGLVQNNVFDGDDIGVLVANSTGNLTIDTNTFENLTHGASEIASGSFGAGIAFFNPTFVNGPITVSNNTFQNSDTGIRTSTSGGTFTLNSPTVFISSNSFTGNLHDIVDKFAGTLTPAATTSSAASRSTPRPPSCTPLRTRSLTPLTSPATAWSTPGE